MNHNVSRRFGLQPLRPLAMLVALALVAVSAWAQSLYFSGPSTTQLQVPTKFSGKGFVPNASVTVMIKAPSGSEAGYSAVTGPDGAFSYTLIATEAGAYTITVTDSGGRVLVSAAVAARP